MDILFCYKLSGMTSLSLHLSDNNLLLAQSGLEYYYITKVIINEYY